MVVLRLFLIIFITTIIISNCFYDGSEAPMSNDLLNNSSSTYTKNVIYQLVIRYFGNTNTTNVTNGDISVNGVGKFQDINDQALSSLYDLGITHIYLTGALRQITFTDYTSIGLPADDPDLVKGKGGSFFAIKDYYDVCPDYAIDPNNRMNEFLELVQRIHNHNMKVIIDLVPNHVGRSYASTIYPERDFGKNDSKIVNVFNPQNNFYYISGTLTLTPKTGFSLPGMDNQYPGEGICRATGDAGGNSSAGTNAPDANSFYETVRLNYGYDYYLHTKIFEPIPDTWKKMDAIIEYWQLKGIDGFRVDFLFTTPWQFWEYAISNARTRNSNVYFLGEYYDGSPYYSPSPNRDNYLSAGFDALYWKGGSSSDLYGVIKGINNGNGKWANDLDSHVPYDYSFDRACMFVENHDETRIANTHTGHNDYWGQIGMMLGKPVSTLMYCICKGPVLLLNGQEVGEAGDGIEGFEMDSPPENARTTFFDYWGMPTFVKWVNSYNYDGGNLPLDNFELRDFYKRLLNIVKEPAISSGNYFGLQYANKSSSSYGNYGQYLFSFLRYTYDNSQRLLVVVNLSRDNFYSANIIIPSTALSYLNMASGMANIDYYNKTEWSFNDLLGSGNSLKCSIATLFSKGLHIDNMPPLSAYVFEIKQVE